MQITESDIAGAFEIATHLHGDSRGVFSEMFREDVFEKATGRKFVLKQTNLSSSKKGVVRGIHFADVPPGQAKYVSCFSGEIIDYVVDIRVGSPTFGKWTSFLLSSSNRKSVFISEGLGHAFVSLTDETVVSYLVTEQFSPSGERGINPLDPEIGIDFGLPLEELILSEKDLIAPSLQDLNKDGFLPVYSEVSSFLKQIGMQA